MGEVGEDALDVEVVAALHRTPPVAVGPGLTDGAEALVQHRPLAATEQARLQVHHPHGILIIPGVDPPRTAATLHRAQRALDHAVQLFKSESRVAAHKNIAPREHSGDAGHEPAAAGHLLHQRVPEQAAQGAEERLGHWGWWWAGMLVKYLILNCLTIQLYLNMDRMAAAMKQQTLDLMLRISNLLNKEHLRADAPQTADERKKKIELIK